MTEIKKGTPVWVWDNNNYFKRKAIYLCYDEATKNELKHIARLLDFNESQLASNWLFAEPISEKEEVMKRIDEAEAKIAEAKKLLNAL